MTMTDYYSLEVERECKIEYDKMRDERDKRKARVEEAAAIAGIGKISVYTLPFGNSSLMYGLYAYGTRENDGSHGCVDEEHDECNFEWRGPREENGGK